MASIEQATAKTGFAVKSWLCEKNGRTLSEIESKLTYDRLDVKGTKAFARFMAAIETPILQLAEDYSAIKSPSANKVMADVVAHLADVIADVLTSTTIQNDAIKRLSGMAFPDETSEDFKKYNTSLTRPAKGEKAVVVTAGEEV